jgi:hypothetical protein
MVRGIRFRNRGIFRGRGKTIGKPLKSQQEIGGIREGYADCMAGRTQPAQVFLEELRMKYGFPS